MKRVVVAAAILSALCGAAGLAKAQTAALGDSHDLQGVWMQNGGGKFGPYAFTPEYQKIYDKRRADEVAGKPYQAAGSSCLPRGLVGMLTTGAYPLEILQTAREVAILKENGGAHRIYLNRQHLAKDDLLPMFFGDSIGHWEGDWLVVDSISLGATDNIDGQAPHSDALHVVERFHRISHDHLESIVTVDDAKALMRPVTTRVTYVLQPDYEIQEFYCTNERNFAAPDGSQGVKAPIDASKSVKGTQ